MAKANLQFVAAARQNGPFSQPAVAMQIMRIRVGVRLKPVVAALECKLVVPDPVAEGNEGIAGGGRRIGIVWSGPQQRYFIAVHRPGVIKQYAARGRYACRKRAVLQIDDAHETAAFSMRPGPLPNGSAPYIRSIQCQQIYRIYFNRARGSQAKWRLFSLYNFN
jgi:hypothetical protein